MSKVELENAIKRFDDVVAVDGINFEVSDGEFLVLVGPSGCGKSTTLRLIAGLEKPTEGRVLIGNEDVTNVAPSNRDIAMVFQNYALYPHMDARRNMTFGVKSQADEELTDAEIERRVENAASTMGIEDLLDRRPGELSGGEQQRVAMGRALIRNPSVLLLDEPLSNLDAKLRDHMRAELASLHEELQRTTVYVTHDQTEAMTLGDRIAVMEAGKIQQIGQPQSIFTFPANRFVAEFIGSPKMNIIECRLRSEGEKIIASSDGFEVSIDPDPQLTEYIDKQIDVGIRPIDLHLADRFDRQHRTAPFSGTIEIIETMGDSKLLHCRVGQHQLRVEIPPDEQFEEGDTVQLVADTHRFHFFDIDSGTTVYHSDPERSAPAEAETARATA